MARAETRLLIYRVGFALLGASLGLLGMPIVNRPEVIAFPIEYADLQTGLRTFLAAGCFGYLVYRPKRAPSGLVNLAAAILFSAITYFLFVALNVNSAWNQGGDVR